MKKILMLLGGLCLSHCLISCVAPVSTEGVEDTMLYASNFTDYANSKVFSYVKGFASSNLRQNKTEPVSVANLTDGSTSVQSYVIANTTDATSPDKNPWFAVDLGLVRTINKVRLVPGAGQDAANGDSSTSLGTYPDAYPVKYRVQCRNASAESGIFDDLLRSLGIGRLCLFERNVLFGEDKSDDRGYKV